LFTAQKHSAHDGLHPPLIFTSGGSEVFFWSPNVLAQGAVEGGVNLYEWDEGQITLLSTGDRALPEAGGSENGQLQFAGASADGKNVYFSTPRALLPQDFDERADLYVARVGGGLAPPPPPPPLCDALAEGG